MVRTSGFPESSVNRPVDQRGGSPALPAQPREHGIRPDGGGAERPMPENGGQTHRNEGEAFPLIA